MNTINRLLKIASILQDLNNMEELEKFCVQCDAFLKKYSHYAPMQGPGDYDFKKETENLPWSGSTTEFLKKYPGGLPQWNAMRKKLKEQSFEIVNDVMTTKNEIAKVANPLRPNMDYTEISPYFGSVAEFLEQYPGGIKDWIKERSNRKLAVYLTPQSKKILAEWWESMIGTLLPHKYMNYIPIDEVLPIGKEIKLKVSGSINNDKAQIAVFDSNLAPYILVATNGKNFNINPLLKKATNLIFTPTLIGKVGILDGGTVMRQSIKKRTAYLKELMKNAEYDEPTDEEKEEARRAPSAEETILSKKLTEKILNELIEDGLVSKQEAEEWRKKQPLKIEQRKNETSEQNDYECEVCGDTRLPVSEYGEWAACPGCGRNADDTNDLREELAELEHDQWMEWAKNILKSEDISKEREERWEKESFKPYDKLSEEQKDMDREWADKVLKIVKKHKSLKSEAHYEPVGPDDTKKFEKEPHLYSDRGLEKFKSVKEFVEKRKKMMGQSADDAAASAIKDFIEYWKLLLKSKNKRQKARGKK